MWLALLLASAAGIYETLPTARTGIDFSHDNGITLRRRLPESVGPGVALLDYDSDGRLDIFFVNGAGASQLWRNNGALRFTNVTSKAGLEQHDYGIGAAVCDYNRDGRPDLFLTAHGRNTLWHNNGDGTFRDVTRTAGLDRKGLWTAAVFFDADGDGDEDLFLGHFVAWEASSEPECRYGGRHHYCHPLSYPPASSFFYRNNGDGTFTDVSDASGIAAHKGKVFGAVATDIDNDGRLDLFVANDSVANFLFRNKGELRFEETGLEAGVAYSADGNPRSGMGVDAADYNGDGFQDLFVANFNRERFSIYRNNRDGTFTDEAGPTGIGIATQMYSGWGVRFFDVDHDGHPDLIVCNSHPDDQIGKLSTTLTYREPLLLFRNERGRFRLYPPGSAGDAFTKDWPARGLAVGDLDNDGFPDVVVANTGEAPLILRHTGAGAGRWIGLDLGPRTAGSLVRWSAGGVIRQKRLTAGGSFVSTDDPRVLLGLGTSEWADWIEIRVPGQPVRRMDKVQAGRYYTPVGSGLSVPEPL
jgi:enediyne biosynthesis protein E4